MPIITIQLGRFGIQNDEVIRYNTLIISILFYTQFS
jgi:hypothetical protein